ncbi:MAG: DUF1559 domain-containing protein [Planctomycetaceae bacterium]
MDTPWTIGVQRDGILMPRGTGYAGVVTKNKLKQMGLAMHNHHDVFNRFPVDDTIHPSYGYFDETGRPKLSWRVYLLPMLDHLDLFNQFHLNESWDSPHNLALLDKMPDVFRSVGDPFDSSTTRFQVFRGPDGLFGRSYLYNGIEKAPRIRDITDGISNTFLIAEAGASKAVPWTQPSDIEFDPADPLGSLGLTADDLLTAVMADGSGRQFSMSIPEAMISALVSPTGGEIMSQVSGLLCLEFWQHRLPERTFRFAKENWSHRRGSAEARQRDDRCHCFH